MNTKTAPEQERVPESLPSLSIDRKGFETCWMAMAGIASCIWSIIRENKKVRIVIEYNPDDEKVYLHKKHECKDYSKQLLTAAEAALVKEKAAGSILKYGQENAYKRIKEASDLLFEYSQNGGSVGNSLLILGAISAAIRQCERLR